MGYGSVILVISVIIISGVLLLSMTSATSDADEELNEYHHKTLARDAAVTGLELAVRCLADPVPPGTWTSTPSWTSSHTDYCAHPTTSYSNGSTFRVETTWINNDSVDVIARGFNGLHRDPNTGATEPISQVIFARYAWEKADGGIPPAFRNAITADDYEQNIGNVEIFGINGTSNASIHINDDMSASNIYVYGYGTYTKPTSLMPAWINNFVPNVDFNGPQPNVYEASAVPVPEIDMTALRDQAMISGAIITTSQPSYSIDGVATPVLDFTNPGTLPWAGSFPSLCTNCGTKSNPFILVVEKPLFIYNRVRIKGYAVIVSSTNVSISPQIGGGGVFGDIIEVETTVILASFDRMNVGGPVSHTCMGLESGGTASSCTSGGSNFTNGITLYARTVLNFETGGSVYLVGGIVAPTITIDLTGDPLTMTYAAPPEAITDPGFEFQNPIGPVLVSYSEW